MHRTIRRRPLFALFVGIALITFSVLLNACQPSEARLPDTPDQAAVRILRVFYTADCRQRDHWLSGAADWHVGGLHHAVSKNCDTTAIKTP